MANQFISSWVESKLPYDLIILDNQSDVTFDRLKEVKHTYIRIDDQIKIGGITGAWNILIKTAYDSGADIITGFADDVKINTSLSKLVEHTVDDNTIYVPLTDGMLDIWPHQKSNGPKSNSVVEVKNINGFWMSFTRVFYEKRNVKADLFDLSRKEIDRWSRQENMLNVWNETNKTYAKVIGDCWIHHTKLRSWREARNKYEN